MDEHKVSCHVKNIIVTYNECVSCHTCMPRYILKSLLQKYLHDEKSYPVNEGIVQFRASELAGNPCVRNVLLSRIKPIRIPETLSNLFRMNRGTNTHEWLLQQFYYGEVRVFKKYEIDGIKAVLNGRIDGYDEEEREILDLKTTEFPPSLRKYGKAWKKHEEQVQIYENLSKEQGLLNVEKLRILYCNFGIVAPDDDGIVNIGEYFESYPVQINPNILKQKETLIIEKVLMALKIYKDTGKIQLPDKQKAMKCNGCVYRVVCDKKG